MSRDVERLRTVAELPLSCLHREYPNKIAHRLDGDRDVRPPRELTPAFFGAFDWHSAVHGHWCLVRCVRAAPDLDWSRARAALDRSLTPDHVAGEIAYLEAPGRGGFEMPYGMAWLLSLAAELALLARTDGDARRWSDALEPLARLVAERLVGWLRRLPAPIRTGEHTQSAFSMTLALDAARVLDDAALERLVRERAHTFYAGDRDAPLAYEPSAYDFLSPVLAEMDLMRRILPPAEFSAWLGRFAPGFGRDPRLAPVSSVDPADGRLAHWDGLDLSRAWMLDGVAEALPPADPRTAALRDLAVRHATAGMAAVNDEHYAGAHWLGTFAVMWLTRTMAAARALPSRSS